ncbi:MAG: TolC family protein [Acidobacteriota bacterium]|nr:TolC family protein [Acidobacteriota bacterium]
MHTVKSQVSLLCVSLLIAPFAFAQDRGIVIDDPNGGMLSNLRRPYQRRNVPAIDLSNTNRLESLLRAGKIYLSLQDTIALALENNLDIALQRYNPLIAESDLLRARAGGLLRGIPQSVQNGPSSAGGNFLLSSGGGGGGGATSASSGTSSGVNGVITQLGPSTPNFDPILQGSIGWQHQTSPQSNIFSFGTTALVATNKTYNFLVTQGFASGANATLSYNNFLTDQNSGRQDINPYTTSSLDLLVQQPLLQGLGFTLNRRQITIAKNNLKVEDYVFKEQVILTVSNVIGLYWDLVSLNAAVKVARESLGVSEKLFNDNKKQVEIGTLAPIEIVRAEAEVAAREQDLTVAETNVLEQETIIKNALSRTGVASPSIAEARIVPTDSIHLPDVEQVQPVQDLVDAALGERPELAQSRINLENSQINLVGSRNGLLPTLNAFMQLTNHAQAGQINALPTLGINGQSSGFVRGPNCPANICNPVNGFFVGGYGTVLGQLFGRDFPDYRVGVNLNIPLRNRAAQADYVRDQLTLRQSQLTLQKQINQIRVDVQNSLIALQQARARYQAATKQRILEEQTLDAEQKKYALGASTIYQVIQTQRDLANSQSSEVNALSQYSRARVNLDVATGQILRNNQINMEEAAKGVVNRPPAALPVLDQNGNGAGTGRAGPVAGKAPR